MTIPLEHTDNHKAKLQAYHASIWVNAILPPLKLIVGAVGNSASLIADGINSLTDILSNLIVYLLLKVSGKPQDEDHDYGHGKYETVATFALGALMVVAGILIIVDAGGVIGDYFAQGTLPESPSWYVLLAALLAIGMKEWAYRYTDKKARETHSEALHAQALDHRSDVFTSLAVVIGAGCAIFIGGKALLMEPLAAIVVACFVINMGAEVIKPALSKLTEGSLPNEVEEEIIKIAKSVEGIQDPHNLRTRMVGSDTMAIEMDVRMNGNLSLYEAHDLTIEIEHLLKERFGDATHIIIHTEPCKPYKHKIRAYKETEDGATK